MELILLMLSPSAIAWLGRDAIQNGDTVRYYRVCLWCWLAFSMAISLVDTAENGAHPNLPVHIGLVLVSQAVGLLIPASILRSTLRNSESRQSAALRALPLGLINFFVGGIASVVINCAVLGCG